MNASQLAQDVLWRLVVVGAGLLLAAFPGLFATASEAADAVGSRRSDVEPTRWRVLLTRAVGVCLVLFGLYALGYRVWGFDPLTLFAVLVG